MSVLSICYGENSTWHGLDKESKVKKLLAALAIAMIPWLANAVDVNINFGETRVQTPAAAIIFGSRNPQGYYWDGQTWRDPTYWRRHHGPRGERYYTGNGRPGVPFRNGSHCPPGQAKKGHCGPSHFGHPDRHGNHRVSNPQHCPPGLAKQGRC